ncbi:hypothetical protein [Paraburkholderia hospita]|uniref:Uncharacterized protein n=1 Tax=Paraburkholderia hospita TaxID=169430 RepID=A0AAN1JHE9_9BURK|nr:hypothetical protein [Paraburkholderia hospita]AUT74046.1 hypothetical protein C2L64_37755 [Paraburkholderia hospita]EIN02956.1 hypothetical protein WQE_01000 [Paraburkholderia hospita]OUL78684.1 hypothetical protein CA602_31060 [Paraburkholderia hospita]SEH45399.1 hypothetical protein SAMN05192544_100237 [Paraburkholderia hospita]
MNINSVYITGDNHEYGPAEVAVVLPAIVSQDGLTAYAASRLAGFDRMSAACACFHGVEASPENLARVAEHFEKELSHEFDALCGAATEALGGAVIRNEWKRLRASTAVASRDFVMVCAARLERVVADLPAHKREKYGSRLESMKAIKRDGIDEVTRRAAIAGERVEHGRGNGLTFIPQ